MTLVELEGYSKNKVENIDWLTDKASTEGNIWINHV